jgi:hypothetical protein
MIANEVLLGLSGDARGWWYKNDSAPSAKSKPECVLREMGAIGERGMLIETNLVRRSVIAVVLMKIALGIRALSACPFFAHPIPAQTAAAELSTVSLTVPSGAPLRLYLTKRVSKRIDASVEAKLMEPVYTFDREMLPAGTVVLGKVSRTQPVSKGQRFRAILSGDFTPLRLAQVRAHDLEVAGWARAGDSYRREHGPEFHLH